MYLTEEQKGIGRRNFLKVIAGAPALVAIGAAALTSGPLKGGPVKAALIGTGDMGTGHLRNIRKEFMDMRVLCDINPRRRAAASDLMVTNGWPKPKEYDDWHQMLEKEDLEMVLIATPLWTHAEIAIGCLNAGKHVLCEKMIAKNEDDARRMMEAARRNNRLLEIGYQRYYNPTYIASYENIIKPGLLGDVYYARTAWHRNSDWRRKEEAPANFDGSKWGYPDWEHLLNWRMYRKYSEGLMAELGSHKMAVVNWFLNDAPTAVSTYGTIARYKDGREVNDHVYATYEYPGGRSATFTSIESNAFDNAYEMFMGTKGTLILENENEAYLFNEGGRETKVEVSQQTPGPVTDASATKPGDTTGRTVNAPAGNTGTDRNIAYQNEKAEFCAAIRTGSPLRCGPERAIKTATACLMANRSADEKARLEFPK